MAAAKEAFRIANVYRQTISDVHDLMRATVTEIQKNSKDGTPAVEDKNLVAFIEKLVDLMTQNLKKSEEGDNGSNGH